MMSINTFGHHAGCRGERPNSKTKPLSDQSRPEVVHFLFIVSEIFWVNFGRFSTASPPPSSKVSADIVRHGANLQQGDAHLPQRKRPPLHFSISGSALSVLPSDSGTSLSACILRHRGLHVRGLFRLSALLRSCCVCPPAETRRPSPPLRFPAPIPVPCSRTPFPLSAPSPAAVERGHRDLTPRREGHPPDRLPKFRFPGRNVPESRHPLEPSSPTSRAHLRSVRPRDVLRAHHWACGLSRPDRSGGRDLRPRPDSPRRPIAGLGEMNPGLPRLWEK